MSTQNEHAILATLHLRARNAKPFALVTRFAVAPKVDDMIEIDQSTIRRAPDEALHQTTWRVVDVRHSVHQEPEHDDDLVADLSVTAEPLHAGVSSGRH